MIEFLTENASAVVFCFGGLVVAAYMLAHSSEEKNNLHRKIYDLLLVWLAGTSLPVSVFLIWMAIQPSLIPQMSKALQQFSLHLGAYGGVSLFVLAHSIRARWPRKAAMRDN